MLHPFQRMSADKILNGPFADAQREHISALVSGPVKLGGFRARGQSFSKSGDAADNPGALSRSRNMD
jgi:hypothetical protein